MADVSSIQNFRTLKKRSGLSSEKRVKRVPAVSASPNSAGRIVGEALLFNSPGKKAPPNVLAPVIAPVWGRCVEVT